MHIILYFIFYILCFISYFLFILFYAYFPCVVFYNICTVHGADLTHISLLVIQSLYSRVYDKQNLNLNLNLSMNYWNHVLWSDESKVNLFDSDGVQHVWRRPGEEYQ